MQGMVVLLIIQIVNVIKKKKMTPEQIKQEAAKRYIKGSASYFAFIYGAEYVLEHKDNGKEQI